MNIIRTALLCAALVAALPATAWSDMTEADRAELHAEIRSYLLENPEIIVEVIALLEEKQKAGAAQNDAALVSGNAEAIFDDGFSFVAGNPDGDFTIVEFVDYQCGFCRRAHPEVRELVASDGDIRLIVKEMPILGPGSELASRAAISTLISQGPEAYGRLNNILFALEGEVTEAALDRALTEAEVDAATVKAGMDDDEVNRRLAETRELAGSLAITGTPTFVFGDGMVRGYVALAAMRDIVERARATN